MKHLLLSIVCFTIGILVHSQQNKSMDSYYQDVRSSQQMDKLTNIEEKLTYSNIDGSPYYKLEFVPAKFGNSSTVMPIRYNCYTDTVELLNGSHIEEIPKRNIIKNSDLTKFTFEKTNETLVLVDNYSELSGYFFRLATGKISLLKKMTVKFKSKTPDLNHLVKGTPPKFEKVVSRYYIKTENDFFVVSKDKDTFLKHFPKYEEKIKNYIKENKIKLNREADLLKLVTFINTY